MNGLPVKISEHIKETAPSPSPAMKRPSKTRASVDELAHKIMPIA